jgi:hypothetical protein
MQCAERSCPRHADGRAHARALQHRNGARQYVAMHGAPGAHRSAQRREQQRVQRRPGRALRRVDARREESPL